MGQNRPMEENFNLLKQRVMDTIKNRNINKKMKKIKGSTICVGNGGSNVVASFASLVLNKKNNCPCKLEESRDVLYENIKDFDNLFVCSYSGTHLGVNILKPLKIKKYLLTYGEEDKSYITLKCSSNIEKEKSFISLATTLMSMSVLLSYYESNCTFFVKKELDEAKKVDFSLKYSNLDYEIMSGNDTITPERYLESTFTESGLTNAIVHKKYDYCHGRSTLAYKKRKNLIYLVANRNELDDLLLEQLKNRYANIIVLESNYNDLVLDNFSLTIKAMYLSRQLALKKGIDLSIVDYDKELSKILYKYQGEM